MREENSFLAPLERSTLETQDLQALIAHARDLRAQAIRDHGSSLFGLLARVFRRQDPVVCREGAVRTAQVPCR